MLTLRELQSGFRRSITEGAPDELLDLIAGNGLGPAARLSIYRNNVVTRLTDTLRTAYPVVCQLVGRGFFDGATEIFLRQSLPVSGSLSNTAGPLLPSSQSFPRR